MKVPNQAVQQGQLELPLLVSLGAPAAWLNRLSLVAYYQWQLEEQIGYYFRSYAV